MHLFGSKIEIDDVASREKKHRLTLVDSKGKVLLLKYLNENCQRFGFWYQFSDKGVQSRLLAFLMFMSKQFMMRFEDYKYFIRFPILA
jgi:hypothetical protein